MEYVFGSPTRVCSNIFLINIFPSIILKSGNLPYTLPFKKIKTKNIENIITNIKYKRFFLSNSPIFIFFIKYFTRKNTKRRSIIITIMEFKIKYLEENTIVELISLNQNIKNMEVMKKIKKLN
tara:strand:+ start:2198 stop:2566 length:369 start_codon:yes stop_codon:yes gene_type:complete